MYNGQSLDVGDHNNDLIQNLGGLNLYGLANMGNLGNLTGMGMFGANGLSNQLNLNTLMA